MLPINCVLACFATLSLGSTLTGCSLFQPRTQVIPDQTIPHRLAQPIDVVIWARTPDGKFQQQPVHVPDGWWIASPQVVTPPSSNLGTSP